MKEYFAYLTAQHPWCPSSQKQLARTSQNMGHITTYITIYGFYYDLYHDTKWPISLTHITIQYIGPLRGQRSHMHPIYPIYLAWAEVTCPHQYPVSNPSLGINSPPGDKRKGGQNWRTRPPPPVDIWKGGENSQSPVLCLYQSWDQTYALGPLTSPEKTLPYPVLLSQPHIGGARADGSSCFSQ